MLRPRIWTLAALALAGMLAGCQDGNLGLSAVGGLENLGGAFDTHAAKPADKTCDPKVASCR